MHHFWCATAQRVQSIARAALANQKPRGVLSRGVVDMAVDNPGVPHSCTPHRARAHPPGWRVLRRAQAGQTLYTSLRREHRLALEGGPGADVGGPERTQNRISTAHLLAWAAATHVLPQILAAVAVMATAGCVARRTCGGLYTYPQPLRLLISALPKFVKYMKQPEVCIMDKFDLKIRPKGLTRPAIVCYNYVTIVHYK